MPIIPPLCRGTPGFQTAIARFAARPTMQNVDTNGRIIINMLYEMYMYVCIYIYMLYDVYIYMYKYALWDIYSYVYIYTWVYLKYINIYINMIYESASSP